MLCKASVCKELNQDIYFIKTSVLSYSELKMTLLQHNVYVTKWVEIKGCNIDFINKLRNF